MNKYEFHYYLVGDNRMKSTVISGINTRYAFENLKQLHWQCGYEVSSIVAWELLVQPDYRLTGELQ